MSLAIPAAHGWMVEGVVVRMGAVVYHLQPGDHVVFTLAGDLTPYATLPSASVYAQPALDAALGPGAAAQLPAFVAADYALEDRARLEPGERVLIHGAEDAAGLAALQIAQRAGAVVYATARGDEARERVRALGVAHVFAWDSLEFADGVAECTGGAGVDVVFSTLAGDPADRALPLLAPFGRFLDVRSGAVGPATSGGPLRANQSLSVIDVHS